MRIKLFLTIAIVLIPSITFGQGLIDAVRLTGNELPTGPRNAGLDGSLLGTFGGYDALQWNPAALAPAEHSDFGISGFNRAHNSSSQFLGNTSTNDESSTDIGSLGILYPMPTSQGHLAFAFSYDEVRDYTAPYAFNAINPNSSYLDTRQFINDQGVYYKSGGNTDYVNNNNLAYHLGLTNGIPDSGIYSLQTPLKKGLRESGTVIQEGSLHAFRLGGGVDIAQGLSVGATINLFTGSYNYERDLHETNVNGAAPVGDTAPLGFQNATIVDTRVQQEQGISLKLGLLSYSNDVVRFGFTVETPGVFSVTDHYHQSGTANFTSGSFTSADAPWVEPDVTNTYDVTTPMKMGAGVSLNLLGGMITASASYMDMSQLRFSNWSVDLSDLNDSARQNLRGVLSWQVGAEYMIKPIGLALRAGFGMEPSPYKSDPSSYAQTTFSGGATLFVSKNVALEAAYRHIGYTTDHLLYGGMTVEGAAVNAVINSDVVARDEVTIGLDYRF